MRLAYAAAHVAFDAGVASAPARRAGEHIDWQATAAHRRRLAEHGFAVAEAMDTAQRFELGPEVARALIDACAAQRLPHGFIAGAGADGVPLDAPWAAHIDAVVAQAAHIRAVGGEVILLPLPALAARSASPATYVEVYGAIAGQLDGPVFVHWLGEAFAPALAGYFPADSFERVMASDPSRVAGAKLSLLDPSRERRLRRRLLRDEQIVLTGDDWHFAQLIAGDAAAPQAPAGFVERGGRRIALGDFSHALLGVFDATFAPAGAALACLARGDRAGYEAWMGPVESFGRAVFEVPVAAYKAGLAFTAWLAGWQDNALLAGQLERQRDPAHYLRVARLAAAAGVIEDEGCAAARLAQWLAAPPSKRSGSAPR